MEGGRVGIVLQVSLSTTRSAPSFPSRRIFHSSCDWLFRAFPPALLPKERSASSREAVMHPAHWPQGSQASHPAPTRGARVAPHAACFAAPTPHLTVESGCSVSEWAGKKRSLPWGCHGHRARPAMDRIRGLPSECERRASAQKADQVSAQGKSSPCSKRARYCIHFVGKSTMLGTVSREPGIIGCRQNGLMIKCSLVYSTSRAARGLLSPSHLLPARLRSSLRFLKSPDVLPVMRLTPTE